MKALSFLGAGPYTETVYVKHDDNTQSYKTHLFPKAVAELYAPDEMILFVTPFIKEDKHGYLKYLHDSLGSQLRVEEIPNGNTEAQLWEIFEQCANAVDVNDEMILDITHAFRSLPILIFIVAAYLRQIKAVNLKSIIYGAFEARDAETGQTPIFELTPFVKLLDWTNAVNVFQNSGDARPIADLDVQEDIAEALVGLSNALLTNRTFEAQSAAFTFNGLNLHGVEHRSSPFGMLITRLQSNYRDMAVYAPSEQPKQSLKKQWVQIKWYVENQHYLQAVTLIREWLISYECIQQEHGNWLSQGSRDAAEKALKERRRTQFAELAELVPNQIPTQLWEQCIEIRNDLAHCGMRHNRKSATETIKATEKLFQDFEAFVAQI